MAGNNDHIGVVGLGLMGSSIAACMVAAGHRVYGIAKTPAEAAAGKKRVLRHLREMRHEGLLKGNLQSIAARFSASADYSTLKNCRFVAESVFEELSSKRRVIRGIERVVAANTVIGTNTSALPITSLQKGMQRPERLIGIHWAEPAHVTRFMEIICGAKTSPRVAKRAMAFAEAWGKEPSLIRRDIRGFITNRIMYAMMREAFFLVESGICTPEDVDRSVRNDYGSWITFAGPFRFMDITGIRAYASVMRGLFPELSCSKRVPKLIAGIVKSGNTGLKTRRGFFRYTPAQAKKWERRFSEFSYEIRKLAMKYNDVNRMR
jgi:3-hydroxybutyryl-CoA dehydrogenase